MRRGDGRARRNRAGRPGARPPLRRAPLIEIRKVTATGVTAAATFCQLGRTRDEQAGHRVDVAVARTRESSVVRSEHLLTAGMVWSETVRMRLSQRSRGPLLTRHNRILRACPARRPSRMERCRESELPEAVRTGSTI